MIILAKRQKVVDGSCVFCCEKESVQHLFFDCVVARQIWSELSEILAVEIGCSYEAVASKWLSNKKLCLVTIFTSAVLWTLRN